MTEFDLAIYEIDLYGFTIVEGVMTQEEVSSFLEVLIRLD